MTISESDASSESWTKSSGPLIRKLKLCRLYRSYLIVFLTNAIATILWWPADSKYEQCKPMTRLFFFGLMLSSFGAGCVAAFLVRRAEASSHTKWACGYAIINWIQAMLGSLGFTNPYPWRCRYGVIPEEGEDREIWLTVFALCRLLLYIIASFWMQTLIASRLDLLEQSSNQNYRSGCFRKLMWAQVVGAAVALLPIACLVYAAASDNDSVGSASWLPLCAVAGITLMCNAVASAVAICSFRKSFRDLQRIFCMARENDMSVSASSSLRRARRFAALQATGVSFSLVSTLLLGPACVTSLVLFAYNHYYDSMGMDVFKMVVFLIQVFDALGNAVAVLFLSGSHRMAKVERSQQSQRSWKVKKPDIRMNSQEQQVFQDANWGRKVEELSMRGMTLRSLLQFYEDQLPLVPHMGQVEMKVEEKDEKERAGDRKKTMQDWKYVAKEHKTRDVVRRAIIPLTSREECAFSVSAFNRDGPKRAQVMVTHHWGNLFGDLLAAVLSDALQECSFNLPAQLLQDDCAFLQDLLAKMGRLDDTYWICAFAVNQHVSICHSNPYDRDPLTNELHPVCHCGSTNIVDSDGRSASSEINKFDDMMCLLATTGGCRQVVAVDKSLDLFRRAWCVAEIAEAKRLEMDQSLKLLSKATLQERAWTLENLDVRDMRASCEKDKELILGKIHDVDEFNAELHDLIFNPKSGLVAMWHAMDSLQQIGEVGRLIRWGLADAGSGRVWKVWEGHS